MTEQPSEIFGIMRAGAALFGVPIENLAEVVGPLKQLSPIMTKSDHLLGGLDLRGGLIPVIDPASVCQGTKTIQSPEFVAVLRHHGRLVGVGVDEIVGLATVQNSDVKRFDHDDTTESGAVCGGFLKDGSLVSVLNISHIFRASGVPSVEAVGKSAAQATDADRVQLLTFEAGTVLFSVKANDVFGAVPRQPVDQNSLTGGACLGTIIYHNRRIPVMCAVSVLGLGKPVPLPEPEIVVLRFPNEKLLGLAVTAINDIEAAKESEFIDVPKALTSEVAFLRQLQIKTGGGQVFLLDADAIREDRELIAIADLGHVADQDAGSIEQDDDQNGGSRSQRTRFLLFRAGDQLAVPLEQVSRVLTFTQTVTPLNRGNGRISGFFSHDNASVPLIDLSVGSQDAQLEPQDRRILLVSADTQTVGFAVDSVKSIERADWTHQYDTGRSKEIGSMVEIGSSDSKLVVEAIDLEGIAREALGLQAG